MGSASRPHASWPVLQPQLWNRSCWAFPQILRSAVCAAGLPLVAHPAEHRGDGPSHGWPATNEQIEAALYLAATGDQRWYPLLRYAAVKNARISTYPAYAAELGGEKMLPVLVTLEKSPDKESPP